MALAGYCRQCAQYVYLNDQWGCMNGHAWNEISGWYEPETGTPVTPPWMQAAPAAAAPASAPSGCLCPSRAPAPEPVASTRARRRLPVVAPAPVASDRLTLLADMLVAFAQYPSLNAHYGTDTDIVVDNQLVDANWGTGKKKVEYSAIMKAVEPELTLYFWEIVKESAPAELAVEAETYSTRQARSGVQKMVIIGADGLPVEWEWDYAATRSIVEDVASRHGWTTKVVQQKESAQW